MSDETTHYERCWQSGAKHYACAVKELAACAAAFDRQQEMLDRNAEQIATLHQCLRNVYEVWAGSEGIPAPTVASEAYLLSLVEQMRDAAKEGLNGG